MITIRSETKFNTGSWLALGLISLIMLLCLPQIGYRMSLPSEGWIFPLDVSEEEQRYIFTRYFENRPTPFQTGDVLISIEGQPVKTLVENAIRLSPQRPANWQAGQTVQYTVLRGGQQLNLDVELQSRSLLAYLAEFPAGTAWPPGLLLQVVIGLFIFWLRPGSRAAQFFLVWAILILTNLLSVAVSGQNGSPAELFYIGAYWPSWYFNILVYPFFIEPMLIHFFLFFPVIKYPLQRRPVLTLSLIYGFVPILLGPAFLSKLDQPLQLWTTVPQIGFILLSPPIWLVPIISLVHTLRTISEPVQRAQARWLLFGFVLGWVIGSSILFFLPELGVVKKSSFLTIITALSVLALPISMVVSVLRYRLFDIEFIIRRTLTYGIFTTFGFAAYFLIVGSTSALLQIQNSLIATVITLTLIMLLFAPARQRLLLLLDRFIPLTPHQDVGKPEASEPAILPDRFDKPTLIWLMVGFVVCLALVMLVLFFLNWSTPVPATWGFEAGLYNTPDILLYKLSAVTISVLLTALLGLLIIIRQPRHPIGWLLYLVGCIYGLVELNAEYTVYSIFTAPGSLPGDQFSASMMSWIWVIPFSLSFWMIAIFPDGHLPSPRWRWVFWSIISWTIGMSSASLFEQPMSSAYFLDNPLSVAEVQSLVNFLFNLSVALLGITVTGVLAVMIYRFQRSQGEQRQQLKWLAGAILLTTITIITGIITRFVLNFTWGEQLFNVSLLFLPLGISIATLRYRLYDIDLIIRRTLVYGALVGGLTLVYFSSVALLQFLSQTLTGPQSNLAVVAITLVIAALFNPARRRFQEFIDRRYYREAVDARLALIAFAREVRTLIDLPELLRTLVSRTTDLLHISHGAVYLVDERNAFQLAEARHLPQNRSSLISLRLQEDDLTRLRNGQPISRPTHLPFPLLIPLIAPQAPNPRASNDQPLIGLLALGPRLSEQDYSREDQTLLTGLADQAGTAIYVAQLIQEKQAEAQRREESEQRLEAYRNSPAGRAETFAQALISDFPSALIELHTLTERASTDADAAALLEPLPAALTAVGAPQLTGLADGYRYLLASQSAPELLSVGLRELIAHLSQLETTELRGAVQAQILYQLCHHTLEANSIPQIVESGMKIKNSGILPPLTGLHTSAANRYNETRNQIKESTQENKFLNDLSHGLIELHTAAQALHAYERVDTSQDKLAYLAGALERLGHADRLARIELGATARSLIQRIANSWLAVVTGTMSELQTRARLACRLLTRHTWSGEIISLTLAIRNEGGGAALNVKINLIPAPEYTLLDEAAYIERLAAGEEQQIDVRVRPRLAQGLSHFRAHFALLYDDPYGSGQIEHFADVVYLLVDEGDFQFIPNPYVVGTPLQSGSPLFFGREDIIQFIQENLAAAHQNNLVLIGQRRTGKTSLLKQLPNRLGDDFVPVYLDGQSLALDPGLPNFFYSLATEIIFTLEDGDFGLAADFDLADFVDSPATAFERKFLTAVRQAIKGRHLLLLLDEFEELETAAHRGNIDASVFGFLRHLIQHTDNLSVIFCGTHRMEELAANYWSVLFNISLYRHVAFLTQNEAMRLIQNPVSDYNMRYDDLALDKIWRVTAGHPYFLQLLCHSLVNQHNKTERNYVTVADVNTALDEILATGEAHFVFLWAESTPDERLALTALSRMTPLAGQVTPVQIVDFLADHGINLERQRVSQTLHRLVLRDILRTNTANGLGLDSTDAYGWQLGLLGLWVEKYKSLSRVVDEVRQ